MDKDRLVADLFKVADDPWPDDWHRGVALEAAFYISGKTPDGDPSWFAIADRYPPPDVDIWLWKDGACWITALHRDDTTVKAELPATHWKPT